MAMLHFTDTDVQSAFPEFLVDVPNVGTGMDKVAYRAVRAAQTFALKILFQPVDDDAEEFDPGLLTERFRRELQGMGDVQCPHIIRVVDEPQLRVIATTKHVWYTEPFMSGGTLYARLKTVGSLPAAEVHRLAVCLFNAVEVMWTQGKFVHRDIKPKNIAFAGDGTPVLLDLGIALFTEMADITSSSLVGPGSQYYAAPEQFTPRRQSNIDFRTDLFVIGIVLVEALTGKHPFKAGSDYVQALHSFDPSSLDNVQMSDGLRRVIPRLLAAHQNRRFRTVAKALAALGEEA